MKKLKTKLCTILGLLLVITVIFVGCKKQELSTEELKANTRGVVEPGDDTILPDLPPLGPDIETLKTYMSSLTNVDISEISYNAANDQFSIYGVEQISLKDLSNSYSESLNY